MSAKPRSEKSAWYRDITTGSTGGAKRQQWGEIAVNVHAVNFITYFRSHLLSSVFLPLVCHSVSFSILLTFISIFWWWRILSSLVGFNRFCCLFFSPLHVVICSLYTEEQPWRIRQDEAAEPFWAERVCFSSITHYSDIAFTDPSTVRFDP